MKTEAIPNGNKNMTGDSKKQTQYLVN